MGDDSRDRLRGFLKSRCPDVVIEDDDIKQLVAQGFNEFAIEGASKDDLIKVLPGRLGVVVELVKTFGEPQLPAGKERSPKRSKTSGSGFSESVDKVVNEWKSDYSEFLRKAIHERCELSTANGVPLDHRGRPSILYDQLTAGWTKDVTALWERAEKPSNDLVPVIGVSGSGKTRFLYELLAEKWGFFWTARTKGNGGSADIGFITEYETVKDKAENHSSVLKITRCAVLARLLILSIFLKGIPDMTPQQWLMLQVQFRAFGSGDERTDDVYLALTAGLMRIVREGTVREGSDGLNYMISRLWRELQTKLDCKFVVVLDEAQSLGSIGEECYKSPTSGSLRSIFSPLVKALQSPSTDQAGGQVFVAGTGVTFLKPEEDLVSLVSKESVDGQIRFASAPFSSWNDSAQVLEFCERYLKLEDGKESDNACYLLRKFRGRRRCLVSCVERLLEKNKGVWSEEVVDQYFQEITSSSSSSKKDITSIYYAVEALCKSKGLFQLNEVQYNADALVQRLGLYLAFEPEGEYIVSTEADETLLKVGLGQLKHSSGFQCTFSIYEPTVHWSILNYLSRSKTLETLLREQMVGCTYDPSALGRLWEKLFTMHVASLFDGTKFLADMCCFKGANLATLHQNFATHMPMITGKLDGVWRESYKKEDKTVSAFLDAREEYRERCLIFNDGSGPDVLFVVRLGDLKIPVLCQLKLRERINWGQAQATTNPESMYKARKYDRFRQRVVDACKDGYISLVVGYPTKVKAEPATQKDCLSGFIGQREAESLFGSELCTFLRRLRESRKSS
ncbi:hypothetical protein KC19_8G083900 [Ceratodon purpureus]|uniref:Uncharacterized protein n=1 Tax=Ceratodon purpureus TaxID=3225 RepID=A0A8T0GZ22_CERPU|nr:hypothetical protein KC19_8G083900 [Ceratodon purpureus]